MMMKASLMNLSALLVVALTTTTSHAFVVQPATKHALSSKSTGMISASSRRPTTNLQSFLTDLFNPKSKQVAEPTAPVFDPVVIDPDFRVAALFLVSGFLLDLIPYIQLTLGPAVTLLGILFLVQTFRIRFVFDETGAFELKTSSGSDDLGDSGENRIVGGANRWDTDTIINYDFFPKGWIDGPVGPILVYFKETQTPADSWNEGPGKLANDPDKIASGEAAPGQVHFFPAVCNAQQIRDEFAKRNCRKI
jgi:hypothetical protein